MIGGLLGIVAAIAVPFSYFEGRIDQLEVDIQNSVDQKEFDDHEREFREFTIEVAVNKIKIQAIERIRDYLESFIDFGG